MQNKIEEWQGQEEDSQVDEVPGEWGSWETFTTCDDECRQTMAGVP